MTADFSSKTMWAGRATFLEFRAKKNQPRILYPLKLPFKNEREILFQTYKSWENSSPAVFTIRNVKGGPSGRKKMMPDENLELHQGMKHHGNANYMGQYKRFFLII